MAPGYLELNSAGGGSATGMVLNVTRFSVHDGPGIRTTVFFKGCPLDCWWCHNPESQSFRPQPMYLEERCLHCGDCLALCPEHAIEDVDGAMRSRPDLCLRCGVCVEACQAAAREIAGRRMGLAELMAEIEKDVVFFDQSGGGVTLSGGEPVSQHRFAAGLLGACRDRGIHTVLETCGYAHREPFLKLALMADLVLFDLKTLDREKHKRYTGVRNDQILRNLEALARSGRPPVVRIPLIPGINDSDDDLRQFAGYLYPAGVRRVDLLPYHRIGSDKYQRLAAPFRLPDLTQPTASEVERFTEALAQTGCEVKVGG